jgi:hypothetical protein
MLLHLHDKCVAIFSFDLKSVVDLWELTFKLNVNHRTDHLFDFTSAGHDYCLNWIKVDFRPQR